MSDWFVNEEVSQWFPDLETTIGCEGELINSNWMSRLVLTSQGFDRFYVKTYKVRGRGLRRHLGRSRARAEWENLLAFAQMGVPSAELAAYGETSAGQYRGVIVTREVRGTSDLSALVEQAHPLLEDRQWRRRVIRRLSEAVRAMHDHGFVHNDLKWRNILVRMDSRLDVQVDDLPMVYLIDCPLGRRMPQPFLARGKVKDLACLDKIAKAQLSRSERLRFYLSYKGKPRLGRVDKREIGRVLKFFEGRE